MQIVVHRQSLEDNLNRYARYAHDLCKICAKDPPTAVGDRHLCKWASRSAAVSHNWGPAPCVAGKLGNRPLYRCIESCIAQLGNSPLSRGNWGKPRNRSWCQRILTICVLFLQSSSTSMGSSAKPNQPMQCKSARCLHIDNASSLLACVLVKLIVLTYSSIHYLNEN